MKLVRDRRCLLLFILLLLLLLLLLFWLPLLLTTDTDWFNNGLDDACDPFDASFLRAVGDDVRLTFEISSCLFLLSKIILLSRTLSFPAALSLLDSSYVSSAGFSVKKWKIKHAEVYCWLNDSIFFPLRWQLELRKRIIHTYFTVWWETDPPFVKSIWIYMPLKWKQIITGKCLRRISIRKRIK